MAKEHLEKLPVTASGFCPGSYPKDLSLLSTPSRAYLRLWTPSSHLSCNLHYS